MSDFKPKMHKIRFPLGLRPRSHWGSLQRSPKLLAVFKGAYPLLRGGTWKRGGLGEEREGEGKRRGKK